MNWSYLLWYSCFMLNVSSFSLSPMVSSPVFLWVMMEINLISFLMLIWSGSIYIMSFSALTVYFITQAFASVMLITNLLMVSQVNSNSILFLILAYKSGIMPFHSWFFYVASKMDLWTFFMVSTSQKIIPLQFFFMVEMNHFISFTLGASAVMASMLLILMNYNVHVLIISSCIMMTWMISGSIMSLEAVWMFFWSYASILLLVMGSLLKSELYTGIGGKYFNSYSSMLSILLLIMYTGIPPSPLFFMKLIIMDSMMMNSLLVLAGIMLMSSIISIYSYLSILLYSFQCNSINWSEADMGVKSNDISMILLSTTFLSFLIMLFM